MIEEQISLSPLVISLLIGAVTPLLTGLIVKLKAASGTKALVGLGLVAAGAGVNFVVAANGVFALEDLVILVAATFVTHVSTYYGVWKPVGSSTEGAPTLTATPDFGFGPSVESPEGVVNP
jgi:uncharacterized membrane protein